MSKTIEQVFEEWLSGKTTKTSRETIFTSDDGSLGSVPLSPLARKENMVVINGDRCCPGGNRGHIHYNIRFARYLRSKKEPYTIIPFSALRLATNYLNVSARSPLQILDTAEDEWKKIEICKECKENNCLLNSPSCKCDCHARYQHQLGASLFKIEDHYLLSVIDGTQRIGQYSLMLLPTSATTIDQGLRALMPKEVKQLVERPQYTAKTYRTYQVRFHNRCWYCCHLRDCRRENCSSWMHKGSCKHERTLTNFGVYENGIMRQGEWFLVPTNKTFKLYERDHMLPSNTQGRANHLASKLHTEEERTFITGKLRHKEGEHYTVYLETNTWYEVFRNTAVMSWTASGIGRFARVD